MAEGLGEGWSGGWGIKHSIGETLYVNGNERDYQHNYDMAA